MGNIDVRQKIEGKLLKSLIVYPKLASLVGGKLNERDFTNSHRFRLYSVLMYVREKFQDIELKSDEIEIGIREKYPNEFDVIRQVVDNIYLIPTPSFEWILIQSDEMIREIKFRQAIVEVNALIDRDDLDNARDRIYKEMTRAGLTEYDSSSDLDLDKFLLLKNQFSIINEIVCPLGIAALDADVKGVFRKELTVIMAGLNVGKSWFACHIAFNALLRGRHVLFLTLEMSKLGVLQRMIQMIAGVAEPDSADELFQERLVSSAEGKTKDKQLVETLANKEYVRRIMASYRKWCGVLKVHEYGSNTCFASDVEKEVIKHEAMFDKLPDLVIVDGLLDMALTITREGRKTAIDLAVKELRRMSGEYDCAVLLTHQANRQGNLAKMVDVSQSGESIGVMQVADTAFSLTQNRFELLNEQLRVKVIRCRRHKKGTVAVVWQDLSLGQFAMRSEKEELIKVDGEETKKKWWKKGGKEKKESSDE